MSTYITIAQTGNLGLLAVKGFYSDLELIRAWEIIVKENAKANGDNALQAHQNSLKAYGKLIADYELVKLEIFKLSIVVDNDSLKYLKSKGYKIDTSAASKYASSLAAALQRSNHFLTQIKSKLNEMDRQNEETQQRGSGSIEEALAGMSAVLGFNITDNITLARFNEYRRIVKKKSQQKAKNKIEA